MRIKTIRRRLRSLKGTVTEEDIQRIFKSMWGASDQSIWCGGANQHKWRAEVIPLINKHIFD